MSAAQWRVAAFKDTQGDSCLDSPLSRGALPRPSSRSILPHRTFCNNRNILSCTVTCG